MKNIKYSNQYLKTLMFSVLLLFFITSHSYSHIKEKKQNITLIPESIFENWLLQEDNNSVIKEKNFYILQYQDIDHINPAAYQIQKDMNWQEFSKVIMQLNNNSSNCCSIAIQIETTDQREIYESPQFLLKPQRDTRVIVNLNAPYFKSKESNGDPVSFLYDKDNIKCISFIIYGFAGKKSSGKIIINKFQFLKGEIFLPERSMKNSS